MKRRCMKQFLPLLTALVLAFSLSACGGSSPAKSSQASGSMYAMDSAATAEAPEAPTEAYWAENGASASGGTEEARESTLPEGVKMIYRADLELETTEFEKAASDIRTLTAEMGGYVEEQSVHNYSAGYRSASYTVRVPAARFEDFLERAGELCHVRMQSQSAEDVSEYYYDMESRLETARIKLDRLQELLSHAEEMEDIITLEDAISQTEYQIESLSGELRHYDALIDYSTINVGLSEVYRVTEAENAPLTFGERMSTAFRDGLRDFTDGAENFAEWLAYSWLKLLVFALVIFAAVKLIWRIRTKRTPGTVGEKRGWLHRKSKNAPTETTEEHKEG